MSHFGIPEDPAEHWKLDGWRLHLEQCASLPEVVAAEFDILRRLSWAAKRGVPTPWARDAMHIANTRWHEIAEQIGFPRPRRR
jgi:hypothetical protein